MSTTKLTDQEKKTIEALSWLTAVDTLIGANVPSLICWENQDSLLELRGIISGLKFKIESMPPDLNEALKQQRKLGVT